MVLCRMALCRMATAHGHGPWWRAHLRDERRHERLGQSQQRPLTRMRDGHAESDHLFGARVGVRVTTCGEGGRRRVACAATPTPTPAPAPAPASAPTTPAHYRDADGAFTFANFSRSVACTASQPAYRPPTAARSWSGSLTAAKPSRSLRSTLLGPWLGLEGQAWSRGWGWGQASGEDY